MPTDLNYTKQRRRLCWAQLRIIAIELRDARQRWANRDVHGREQVLRIIESDLRIAETVWVDTWSELDHYRNKSSEPYE